MKYIYFTLVCCLIFSCNCHKEPQKVVGQTAEINKMESSREAVSDSLKPTSLTIKNKDLPKNLKMKDDKLVNEVKDNPTEVKIAPVSDEPVKIVKKDEPVKNTPILKNEPIKETPIQIAVRSYAQLAEAYRVWMVQSITEADQDILQKAIAAQKAARKLEPDLLKQQKDFNAEQTNTINLARKKLNKSEADFVKEM